MSDFAIQAATQFDATTAGAWEGVPMQVYQDAPGESHSMLTVLARSPRRYRLIRDNLIDKPAGTHDMMLGILIHTAVNEGQEPAYHLRPESYRGPDSARKDAVIVDKDWNANSNSCKDWIAAHQDKPILTAREALMLNSVAACVRADPRAKKLLAGAWREVSACARNDNLAAPYMLRCRFDILGHDDVGWYWVETKSTRDASTWGFSGEIKKRLYHVQTALYRRVLRQLTGDKNVRCYMMPVEKDIAVPRVNVRQLASQAMDLGDKILDERLALLHRCRLANKWPTLTDEEEGEHIPFIDLPDFAYGKTDDLLGMTEVEEEKKT